MAGYPGQFGNVLITKESLDKFINTIVGVPVIINHKDLNSDNVSDERVGVVNSVWYDDKDGWYWCDGIIWDETAQNLITDKNWSVSCSYDVKTADDKGGTENNIKYDMEFLDGVFTHLALVDNPRYERANIVFNSKTFNISNFNPNHDEEGKFCEDTRINPNYKEELKQVIEKAKNNPNERQKLVIGKVTKDLEDKAKENGFDISGYSHDLDVSGARHAFKEHGDNKTEEPRGQIAITDDDFEKIPDVVYKYDNVSFGETDAKNTPLITYSKKFDDGTIIYIEEIRTRQKTLTIKSMRKQKLKADNSGIFTDFNPQRIESISSIYIIPPNHKKLTPSLENLEKRRVENSFQHQFKDIFYEALAEVIVETVGGGGLRNDAEFESKHPRDEKGRFAEEDSSDSKQIEDTPKPAKKDNQPNESDNPTFAELVAQRNVSAEDENIIEKNGEDLPFEKTEEFGGYKEALGYVHNANNSVRINKYLRGEMTIEEMVDKEESEEYKNGFKKGIQETISALDRNMKPLQQPLSLIRYDNTIEYLKEDTGVLKGYTSTSLSSERNVFARRGKEIYIKVPKNTYAYITNNEEESEIILARNSKYTVEKREGNKIWLNITNNSNK